MNSRQKDLLKILLVHEDGALHIKDLAREVNCSEKTVRFLVPIMLYIF